jgi:hypothetical protein
MPVIACKLPHGLQIAAAGRTIVLVGANIGEDLETVSRNGSPSDNGSRSFGYGLTEISDKDAEAFAAWSKDVVYKNGNPADGKLDEPYLALENGSILGPFKSKDEARKEIAGIASAVTTGFEGLDSAKEGVEVDKDANKK